MNFNTASELRTGGKVVNLHQGSEKSLVAQRNDYYIKVSKLVRTSFGLSHDTTAKNDTSQRTPVIALEKPVKKIKNSGLPYVKEILNHNNYGKLYRDVFSEIITTHITQLKESNQLDKMNIAIISDNELKSRLCYSELKLIGKEELKVDHDIISIGNERAICGVLDINLKGTDEMSRKILLKKKDHVFASVITIGCEENIKEILANIQEPSLIVLASDKN